MDVRIARLLGGAREATGHAVIVDVFRAFTTAAFCIGAGADEIVLVADHEQALAMKASDPALFLTGEIGGRKIAGFDAGNSPSEIESLDLSGRRVVQRTSAGTQAVSAATKADAIMLGSLVIAAATAAYLKTHATSVTIVAAGHKGEERATEDEACAEYVAALLRGENAALRSIPLHADYYPGGWPDWFPRRDAELACEIDRFDFALPVARENGLLVARPVRT